MSYLGHNLFYLSIKCPSKKLEMLLILNFGLSEKIGEAAVK